MKNFYKLLSVFFATVIGLFLVSLIHIRLGSISTDEEDRIPHDLSEAISLLDSRFDENTKERILYYAEVPHDELSAYELLEEASFSHLGLGASIRSSWGLWSDSRLRRWFIWRGVRVPDLMSEIILDEFLMHLKGNEIKNLNAQRFVVLGVLSAFVVFLLQIFSIIVKFVLKRDQTNNLNV